ncbi:MAG: ABC transporter ATP-binding protein [Lachnospiraceae bacterium]|nr:ABC transporter ATP-binding protein [Lachnospiraceae bacterium]
MEDKIIVELKNIKKSYDGETDVISDINLKIKKGEFVTLLGPSGCGKTTILRMIGGFEVPTGGEILLHGENIASLPPNERPVNTVFQKYALFPHMNVYENIAFGLKLKKLPKEEVSKKVKRALDVVDLEGFEKRKINTLSGGQQQRIAIARAIVNEPEILLLDEPLGALDYKMRREMQLELKLMHKELGITFIFVTHDQEEALTMSDRIVVLSRGHIQQVGRPEDIYGLPRNAFVADFIGESNIFHGKMSGYKTVEFLEDEFVCEDGYPAGTEVEVVIRPEGFTPCSYEEGKIKGEVISCVFKGTYYETTLLCQDKKSEVVVYSKKKAEVGKEIGLLVEPEDIHVMLYDTHKNHFVVEREGEMYDAYFSPSDARLSDDAEEGRVKGNIVSIIYKGDHYSYTVESEENLNYFVNDEYLWNTGDLVSIVIPEEKIEYNLLKEEA